MGNSSQRISKLLTSRSKFSMTKIIPIIHEIRTRFPKDIPKKFYIRNSGEQEETNKLAFFNFKNCESVISLKQTMHKVAPSKKNGIYTIYKLTNKPEI